MSWTWFRHFPAPLPMNRAQRRALARGRRKHPDHHPG